MAMSIGEFRNCRQKRRYTGKHIVWVYSALNSLCGSGNCAHHGL